MYLSAWGSEVKETKEYKAKKKTTKKMKKKKKKKRKMVLTPEEQKKADKKQKKRAKKDKKEQLEKDMQVISGDEIVFFALCVRAGLCGKVPVLRLERSVGNAEQVLVANTDLPVLRSLAPELMSVVEARVTLDMSTLTLVGAGAQGSISISKGAADMVYFYRCVTWLQLQPGPSDRSKSVYDYFDSLCFGAVRLILHQLWFPPQQVLFALALFALEHNTSAPASTQLSAVLECLPLSLTDMKAAVKDGAAFEGKRSLATPWQLRRLLFPGQMVGLHGVKCTGPWIQKAWVDNPAEWEKVDRIGQRYKEVLDAAYALLEHPSSKKRRQRYTSAVGAALAALGTLEGIGPYVEKHALRGMLLVDLGPERNAALLDSLHDDWLGQNDSGTGQLNAYNFMTELMRIALGLPAVPDFDLAKSRERMEKGHSLFFSPAAMVSSVQRALDNLPSPRLDSFERLGHAGAGCFLCEMVSLLRSVIDKGNKGISVSVTIEWLKSLGIATAGPFGALREEIRNGGGMAQWALSEYISDLVKKKHVHEVGEIQLRRSWFLNEPGVVAISAKGMMALLLPRLQKAYLSGRVLVRLPLRSTALCKEEERWEVGGRGEREVRENFALVLSFMFEDDWTTGTTHSLTHSTGSGNGASSSSTTSLGTLGHLVIDTKRGLISHLYLACTNATPGCARFDMPGVIALLRKLLHGETTSEDKAALEQAKATISAFARAYLSAFKRNGAVRDKRSSFLSRKKTKQLGRARLALGASMVVLGAGSPCDDMLVLRDQKIRRTTAVQKIEVQTKLGDMFAGANANHRAQCILCVAKGATDLRFELPSAYDLDAITVGESLSKDRRAKVVLLRVVQEGVVGALSIYYSGMYYVACSANMLLWVWDYVASQSSYQALKEMAERVVSRETGGMALQGDFGGNADDPDFATFVRAEKRQGFVHEGEIHCITCAATLCNNLNDKHRRKQSV